MACSAPRVAPKMQRIIPLFNRVLIKKDDPTTQSKGGIVLPENPKARILKGTVVATGPGQRNDNGQLMPMAIKPGDYVILPDYGGARIEVEGENYFMYREIDILAKVQQN